ncbi:MAG: GDSL-type esterase/lipase family protein [Sandaracinaceae bacterium]
MLRESRSVPAAGLGFGVAVGFVVLGLSVGPDAPLPPLVGGLLEGGTPPTVEALRSELEPAPDSLGHRTAIEDPTGHALDAVHAALRDAERGQGQARLLFYGGSHTAGDHYTGRMREALQSTFGDAGHGFVNLAPIVTNQWRWGMVLDAAEGWETLKPGFKARDVDRYGVAGAAFQSDEAGAFAALSSDHWGNGREASRLELHYDRIPGGGSLEVWIDGRRVETLETDQDTPAGARAIYDVSDTTHRMEVRVVGDGPVRAYGFVFERARPGVLVDNLGLVGSKARLQLLWDEPLWRQHFESRRPDLIALAYGNNEATDTHLTIAQHEAHLRRVMDRLESAAPDASCLLIGPTDRPRERDDGALEPRPVIADLTEMQRRVAFDRGCGFFDTLAFQGGLGASLVWLANDPPYMRDDRQHLTRQGYRRWGEELTRALLEGYRSTDD